MYNSRQNLFLHLCPIVDTRITSIRQMKEAESFRLQGNDERENEDALRGSGATFYFKCTNLS